MYMHFHGREEELKELKYLFKKRPSMAVLVGRRRIGKTTIIQKMLEDHDGLYFYIDKDKKSPMMLEEFSEYMHRKLKTPSYLKFERWADLYDYLLNNYDGMVAFDEFQRLLDIEPSAITELQNKWDTLKKKSNVFLVLSGSNIGMIKKIFNKEGAPLYKRADNRLRLRPFSFREMSDLLHKIGVNDIKEKIRLFAIFGGVPYYYEMIEKYECKSAIEAIEKLLLREYAPLEDEIKDVMIEGFGKDHPTYYAIISAIALGKTTKKEIGDIAGIKETSLSPYLYDLMEMAGLVEYEVPVTEKREWKSKRGHYILKDPFFEFWFRFIFRNRSIYEIKEYRYLTKMINEQLDGFVGRKFEKIVKEALRAKHMKIGRWWSRKGDEIDLIGLNERALLVECKWQDDVDAQKVLEELIQKAALTGIEKEKEYLIVARSFVKKKEYCLDLKDLKGMFEARHQ
jgi:AAA+ ATPase superfamily predicted ATPase